MRRALPRPCRAQLQVSQRNQCNGLNEAVAAQLAAAAAADDRLQQQDNTVVVVNLAELELYLRKPIAADPNHPSDSAADADHQVVFSWS